MISLRICSGLVVLALAGQLCAQSGRWPEKPVRIVVPFAPGGSTDIIARLLAPRFAQEFGQPFVIDNRPGAGGTIGAEAVTRAAPDGYTFAIVPSSYVTNAALYKLPYDPARGIAPVGRIVSYPLILTVHPSVPANGLKELIDLMRSRPGALNLGSPGTGSSPHLVAEMFQQMTGTRLTHVAYKGDAPALSDLVGGQIQVLFVSGSVAMPQIKAGKVRALAVSTGERSPAVPDLPTIGEQVPGYAAGVWIGMFGPAGTPPEVVARLNQSLGRILRIPEIQERLRAVGTEPSPSMPEEFARLIESEIGMWSQVVKAGNIRIE